VLAVKRETSIYLDLMRVLAAVAVYFSHIKRHTISYGIFDPVGQFGDEGVVIFFVISGIVIAHVAATKERAAMPYALARLARLWSVVVPAIALTIVLDLIGSHLAPEMYREEALPPMWEWNLASAWRAVAPILFLNQVGGQVVSPGTNGPFWSLSYEFWYYVAFGVFLFSRGIMRVLVLLAVATFVNVQIVVYFPLWLAGVYVYGVLRRPDAIAVSRPHILLWIVSGVGVVTLMLFKYKILRYLQLYCIPGNDSNTTSIFFTGESYAIGIMFSINIIAFSRTNSRLVTLVIFRAGPVIRALAKRSFSLYLYQAPMIFFFGALTIGIASHASRIGLVLVGTLGAIAVLANFTELKKDVVVSWLRWAVHGRGRGAVAAPKNPSGV
jgi:peptidoglycan/LPS O-acetylase OafA/YrhL